MRLKLIGFGAGALLATGLLIGMAWRNSAGAQSGSPHPGAWDDRQIADYRLPLAGLGHAPTLISAHDYYALPESNLKTYPVYTPDKEPPGYIDWLKRQQPQPLVDITKLKTEADWIAAGREVFYGREVPRFSGSEDNLKLIRNPAVLKRYNLPTTRDGVILGLRYVVRESGKVELGTDTCAMCHVQVRPDGQMIEGAPNNSTPFGPLMGDLTRRYAQIGPEMLEKNRLRHMREDYRVPYLKDDPNLPLITLPAEKIAMLYDRHPLGVHGRTNTSLLYPVKIANLIGVKDLRYLDRTGTAHHRGIGDMMRYCGLVGDVTDALTRYGDGPEGVLNLDNMGLGKGIQRTPDPLLYALSKYIYSLQAPPNPNSVTNVTRRGEQVFKREGCGSCHTPPLYTNNRLTPVDGFQPDPNLVRKEHAMTVSVGTDPNLALKTRKGTGFYRVPSLRMLWLYDSYLHDGAVGTLEELFDPGRLKSDFHASNVPAKFPPQAVPGHRFGLDLTPEDRSALIAFLRTL